MPTKPRNRTLSHHALPATCLLPGLKSFYTARTSTSGARLPKTPPPKPHPFVSGLLPITREALLELFQLSAGGLRFRGFAPHP